nr:hypothetical protein [uncultured Porphyromonas sp.]
MAKQKGRRYNYIYSKLVTKEHGLTGFIAYCLYKQEKVVWIEEFKEKHKVPPTDKEIEDGFSTTTYSENYITGLMQKAESQKDELLTAWAIEHENEKQKLREENRSLKELIPNSVQHHLNPSWGTRAKGLGKDILFSMISIVLWFLIICAIKHTGFGQWIQGEMFEMLGHGLGEENGSSTQQPD